MTLAEAVKAGHKRVRQPHWAFPEDYLLIDIYVEEGGMVLCGPWAKLYSPTQLAVAGMERPQMLLMVGDTTRTWEPYTGSPAPDEAPSKDERARGPFDD